MYNIHLESEHTLNPLLDRPNVCNKISRFEGTRMRQVLLYQPVIGWFITPFKYRYIIIKFH